MELWIRNCRQKSRRQLVDAAAYVPSRAECELMRWQPSNDVMAATLKVWSNQKYDSVNWHIFTWRTILPSVTHIRFEI